jgi:predicted nucleic acid-binding protein
MNGKDNDMAILLDSLIIIDYFNGITAAQEFIALNRDKISLSVITRAELLVGLDDHGSKAAKNFLNLFPTLPITMQDADLAAELRRHEKWKLPDALQAALAKNHDLKLATRNSKDFPPQHYKFVVIPYHL